MQLCAPPCQIQHARWSSLGERVHARAANKRIATARDCADAMTPPVCMKEAADEQAVLVNEPDHVERLHACLPSG